MSLDIAEVFLHFHLLDPQQNVPPDCIVELLLYW